MTRTTTCVECGCPFTAYSATECYCQSCTVQAEGWA